MKTKKQKIVRIIIALSVCILFLITGLFIFRDGLLQKALVKFENKLDKEYNCTFTVKKAAFDGISGVVLDEITLVPKHADTILSVQKIKTKINLFQLITGDIQLQRLEMTNGFIQLVKNENGRNFDAFLSKEKKKKDGTGKRNYTKVAYQLLTQALNLVPTDMSLNNLSLRMDDMGRKVTMHMHKLELEDKQLLTSINVKTNTFSQNWNIKGFADPRNKKADLRFFNSDTSKIKVPYIDERFHIASSFDSIHINIEKIKMEGNELHVDGYSSISNLTVNHHRIATKDVVIEKARFDYHLLFGSDFVAIDSSSTAQLNSLKIHPYAEYNTEKDTLFKFRVNIPKTKAQNFINSLPKGLFTHFEGMEAEGDFAYKLDFKYNKNNPNDLVFDSSLTKENLKIIKYGEADLAKLNSEFTYRAIENDIPQRPIVVGPSNPNFTPLDQISPYLRNGVLTSEDPSFFNHRGFINEAFKQSIIKNIKAKKFARGASTISMQLVKNVFLTREKTLSRKLEEILLVYILENNRIASKERMLEVYFNIIEWGPNVYGIGEASRFYFQKHPADLTLKESLYLASIIPRPKKFMWQFDNEGHLRGFASTHQNFLTNLMIRRGLLNSQDTIGYSSPLLVSGRARSFLRIKEQDSIPADSIFIKEID
ncbi:transglycosylase domain-containing protein [Flavobacterium sp. '19STA2R22 D10 B1']|uniref:transglycosylase domain-containing protein n=1 Tax=Flavobacterium aerium TaxID=3037261 RepID=UPI00278BFA56|nr:biosynthetic peptidoglycan transglycosylase [Flavobacterium sp. '19STA2R22 D10 B1']